MNIPRGFPLKPVDCSGEMIKKFDSVLVRKIPESLIHDMEEESRRNIMACEGRTMKIIEIDEYGFVWLELIVLETSSEYNSESFVLEPKYVQKQEDS